MKAYKDKCDGCGKFDILKGEGRKCLCYNCRNKKQDLTKKQLSIFDKEVRDEKKL